VLRIISLQPIDEFPTGLWGDGDVRARDLSASRQGGSVRRWSGRCAMVDTSADGCKAGLGNLSSRPDATRERSFVTVWGGNFLVNFARLYPVLYAGGEQGKTLLIF